jgi:hypothetical protein
MYQQFPNVPTNEWNSAGGQYANPGAPVQPAYGGAPAGYPSSPAQPAYPGYQQPGYPCAAPAYPGTPAQPGSAYAPASPQQKSGSRRKLLLIVLGIIVVLGLASGGGAFYFLTRPDPTITLLSKYTADGTKTPAGANGTTFQISGSRFSNNSTITFLLDGKPIAGAPAIQSDAHGNVQANLPVTAAWTVGKHTLTARDASNYVTKAGVPIVIVNQGEAGTPGPNGAPTDSASFQLQVTVQLQDATTGAQESPVQDTLAITGPDGKVCDPKNDTGQPITDSGTTDSGVGYQATYVLTCNGTYKGGKISYTETVTSYKLVYATGLSCKVTNIPYTTQQLDGSFTDAHTASGTFKNDGARIACNDGSTFFSDPSTGTWTGTLS